jgi:type I restriction enzyme M protein
MVALPGQLFTNTQIPACIWFLTKNKTNGTKLPDGDGKGARKSKVLFIDAREKGYMKDRVLRDFKEEEIKEIAQTLTQWQQGSEEYEDIPGYCKSVTLEEIRKNDYVLTPGRYVGAPEAEDDGIPFSEKMEKLTAKLKTQFEESEKLEAKIKENLAGLGYEL